MTHRVASRLGSRKLATFVVSALALALSGCVTTKKAAAPRVPFATIAAGESQLVAPGVPTTAPAAVATASGSEVAAAAGTMAPVTTASVNPADGEPAAAPTAADERALAELAEPKASGGKPKGPRQTLAEVVAIAIAANPEIGTARASAEEASFGPMAAKSGYYPSVDARVAFGLGPAQDPAEDASGFLTEGSTMQRQASVTVRQMVYDFGATRSEVRRARRVLDSQNHRLVDKSEDVALRVAEAYLRILEARALLGAADRYVAEIRRLAKLVETNEQDGNSTVADVSRVNAKIVEAQSVRTGFEGDLGSAEDQFRRLTELEAGALATPPDLRAFVPASLDEALDRASRSNPKLRELMAASAATKAEADALFRASLPRLGLEAGATSRANEEGDASAPATDFRAMFVFRHRIADGGRTHADLKRVEARQRQADTRILSERAEIEADVRENFRSIESARSRFKVLASGLKSSREALRLYGEQFKAGERSAFELMDAQTATFMAEREVIANRYAESKAIMALIRSTGGLAAVLLSDGSGK